MATQLVGPQQATKTPPQLVEELYQEARKLGLLADDYVRHLFVSILRQFDLDLFLNVRERVERARQLSVLCQKPLEAVQPMRNEAWGPIRIGSVVGSGYEYGMDAADRHWLCLGASGFGKSYFTRKVLKHLIQSGGACVVFSKKRDARSIATLFPKKVVLLRLAELNFSMNVLEGPPGVARVQHLSTFSECFCQSQALLLGSGNYLYSSQVELDELLGMESDPGRQASLFELREYIGRKKHNAISRDARFQESILNRLDGILAALGPVLACSRGFPLEQALCDGLSVIIEVDGIREDAALLVTTSIITRLFTWSMNTTGGKPKDIFVSLDDAQELFNINAERRLDESLPIIGMMVARFRTAGMLMASTQTPNLTSTMLRQNSATKVILNMNDWDQAVTAARLVGLAEKDAVELTRLGKGEAVCMKPGFPYPVKVRIAPDQDIEE